MILPSDTYIIYGSPRLAPLHNAWLRVDADGRIDSFGSMDSIDLATAGHEEIMDVAGATVLPAFCDSHTHIIYAGSRHGEFIDKIQGLSYEEIAARGGGILNSADLLHQTSEDELFRQAMGRALEIQAKGTAAFEVKSGYGLNTEDEIKMLRVAARLREAVQAQVRITFLGAHAVGRQYKGRQTEYVDMVIKEMLPAVAAEGLAQYVDVFCDEGFFTVQEMERILEASARYGLKPKVHVDELAALGAVPAAVKHSAVSVDHLERMTLEEIDILKDSTTVATMLPGCSFFSNLPFAPARQAMDSWVAVALASDYNPGSSPSGDMRMIWALGCIKMKLLPHEALAACTINGAAAMELGHELGSISPGKRASLIITRPNTPLEFIPYAYTTPWIDKVMIDGRVEQ